MRVLALLFVLLCAGCAGYITPGGAAHLDDMAGSDTPAARSPLPHFPATLAVVRVQASQYKSLSSEGYGEGRFSVLLSRELLTDSQVGVLSKWPSVTSVSTFEGLPLPEKFESLDDLRFAAAKLQADVLMVYTVDTAFNLQGRAYGPQAAVSFGAVPDANSAIDSTASALFVDVRTGFVYGRATAGDKTTDLSGAWNSKDALDGRRLATERQAFSDLVLVAGKTWTDIVGQYQ